MRTTLTLDDDNTKRLERLRKARGASFKEVVNDVLRHGLNAVETPAKKREPFRTKPVSLGRPLFTDLKEFMAELDEESDRKKLGL
jgi:hypothetical protein